MRSLLCVVVHRNRVARHTLAVNSTPLALFGHTPRYAAENLGRGTAQYRKSSFTDSDGNSMASKIALEYVRTLMGVRGTTALQNKNEPPSVANKWR